MGWDRCGESACLVGGIGGCKDGVEGLQHPPQGSSEGLGAALHPLLPRCQPQQHAEDTAGTPGRERPYSAGQGRSVGNRLSPSCWGCHCALGPMVWHAGETPPKSAVLGRLLCSHSFPCSRMCGGKTRAGASRDEEGAAGTGGWDAAGYQSAQIPGVSPHHIPACAALLETGCSVSVPQFPHVPEDAAPQALPALCLLPGGVGWGWWSLRDPQPSHCPSCSRPVPTGVSGTKTPLVWI